MNKQLPQWPVDARAAPSVLIRSRLFRAIAGGSLESVPVLTPDIIKCSDGTLIEYVGPVLSQAELDVWLALLDLASVQRTLTLTISLYQLLKLLGRPTTGGERYTTLQGQLRKLAAAVPIITRNGTERMRSMLSVTYQADLELLLIEFNPSVVDLFTRDGGGYTYINWPERRALKRSALAQWLHGFYSSHTIATYALDTLRELCGYDGTRAKFKEAVKAAQVLISKHCGGWKLKLLAGPTDRLHVDRRQATSSRPVDPTLASKLPEPATAAVPVPVVAPAPAAAPAALVSWSELTRDGLEAFCTLSLSAIQSLATPEELSKSASWAEYGVPRGETECYDVKAHLIALMRLNRDPGFTDARWHPLQEVAARSN